MTGVRTSSTMRGLNGSVMHDPERTDLPVRSTVAIEQQVIGNPVAAARDRDAFITGNGHAPHDRHARQFLLEPGNLRASIALRRAPSPALLYLMILAQGTSATA